jgi:RNA polymerase sigma-70 factor (ECF subfamily)
MGDPAYDDFFHEVYEMYHRAVFACILARVEQREIAKDLMQEAFLRVWNQIHVGYEMGRDKCRFWIFRITKNLVTDYYRGRATRDQTDSRLRQEALVRGAFDHSPEEVYELKSNVQRIEDALRRLPDELRIVLYLHLLGEMSSGEIGESLGMPAGTVRYRISLARKRVMNELEKYDIKEGRTVGGFGVE